MSIRTAVWRIEGEVASALQGGALTDERELESMLEHDISMLGLPAELLVLSRQQPTGYAGRVDLLCIDGDGELWLVEIKKERTPREVVAQALDYGYWISELGHDDVADLYAERHGGKLLSAAFAEQFGQELPETVNQSHHLVIVASQLDDATERIVRYAEAQGLPINVVLFQTFLDSDRRYLARSWLIDPVAVEVRQSRRPDRKRAPWNGTDYSVNLKEFEDRLWVDARRYGYVSAGGGPRWIEPLQKLCSPGTRVFCYVPGHGYVGVGRAVSPAPVPLMDFTVECNGQRVPITEADLSTPDIAKNAASLETVEHFVAVDWEATVPLEEAIQDRPPLYSNQGVVTRLRDDRTRSVVLSRLGLAADEDGE
jgi:hypothetical protein